MSLIPRFLSTGLRPVRFMSSSRLSRPGPPLLPPKDQKIFEELIRGAATPAAPSSLESSTAQTKAWVERGDELHPDARRPPPPEFEGDVNPVTGERGGPKREPVRHGDWSYAGRATDF